MPGTRLIAFELRFWQRQNHLVEQFVVRRHQFGVPRIKTDLPLRRARPTAKKLLQRAVWREDANKVYGRSSQEMLYNLISAHIVRSERLEFTEHPASSISQKNALQCSLRCARDLPFFSSQGLEDRIVLDVIGDCGHRAKDATMRVNALLPANDDINFFVGKSNGFGVRPIRCC